MEDMDQHDLVNIGFGDFNVVLAEKDSNSITLPPLQFNIDDLLFELQDSESQQICSEATEEPQNVEASTANELFEATNGLLYSDREAKSPLTNYYDYINPLDEADEIAKSSSFNQEFSDKRDYFDISDDFDVSSVPNSFLMNDEHSDVSDEMLDSFSTTEEFSGIPDNNPQQEIEISETVDITPLQNEINSFLKPETKIIVNIEKPSNKAKDGSYKNLNDILVVRPFDPEKNKNNIHFSTVDAFNHGEELKIEMYIKKTGSTDNQDHYPVLDKKTLLKMKKCHCFEEVHNLTPFCVKSDESCVSWNLIEEIGISHVAVLTPAQEGKMKFAIRFLNANFKKDFPIIKFQHLRDDYVISEQKFFVKTGEYVTRTFKDYCISVESNFPNRIKWYEEPGPVLNLGAEADIRELLDCPVDVDAQKQEPILSEPSNSGINHLQAPLKVEISERWLQEFLDILDESDSVYKLNVPFLNDPGKSGCVKRGAPSPAGGGGKRTSK